MKNESKPSEITNDTGAVISEIHELTLKSKVCTDFIHVKTGGKIEEKINTNVMERLRLK